jgi:hypothetical protein
MTSEWTAAARVRISGGRGGSIERSLVPTPYEGQLIDEDVAWAGRGARVEIDVAGLQPRDIAELEAHVARLARRGVEVRWNNRPDAGVAAGV